MVWVLHTAIKCVDLKWLLPWLWLLQMVKRESLATTGNWMYKFCLLPHPQSLELWSRPYKIFSLVDKKYQCFNRCTPAFIRILLNFHFNFLPWWRQSTHVEFFLNKLIAEHCECVCVCVIACICWSHCVICCCASSVPPGIAEVLSGRKCACQLYQVHNIVSL